MIGLIANAAGTLVSGIMAAKENKAQKAAIDERESELEDWYKQEINTNILDTSSSKSALSQLRSQQDTDKQKLANNAVKRGLTSEATVALASNLNQNFADSVTKLAAGDDQRKAQIQSAYMSESSRIDDMRSELSKAKQSALSDFANNVGQTVNSINKLKTVEDGTTK